MHLRGRRTVIVVVGMVLTVGGGSFAATDGFPDPASTRAARDGAKYLATVPAATGSGSEPWRVDQIAEVIVALVAGGGQDAAVDRALDYIAAKAAAFLDPANTNRDSKANGPRVGRVVSGLVAAGKNPRDFAGIDWVARLELYYVPGSGTYGGENFYADTLAMLGVLAAGEPLPVGALERVLVNQCDDEQNPSRDGGWTWQAGCLGTPDTDTTAMATSVLAATLGADRPEVREAREWLLHARRDTGCWGLDRNSSFDNANSCGLAISAVLALEEDPGRAPWDDGEAGPATRLRSLQVASGGFKYRPASNAPDPYATVQAVPGLAGWSYPVAAPAPGPAEAGGTSGSGGAAGSTTTPPSEARRTTTGGDSPGGRDHVTGPTGDPHRTSEPIASDSPGGRAAETRDPIPGRDGSGDPGQPEVEDPSIALGPDDAVHGGGVPSPETTSGLTDPDPDGVGVAGVIGVGMLTPVAGATGWWWRRRVLGLRLAPSPH